MRTLSMTLLCGLLFVAQISRGQPSMSTDDGVLRVHVDGIEPTVELAKLQDAPKGAPERYAVTRSVGIDLRPHVVAQAAISKSEEVSFDVELSAPGAVALDFGFSGVVMPVGSRMELVGRASTATVLLPEDVSPRGTLWTPYVEGDRAVIRLVFPKRGVGEVQATLDVANLAFMHPLGRTSLRKAGTCNVDTICNEGNAFRDQIRAVAMYTFGGARCTGQLLSNTSRDLRRFFSTANHCVSSQAQADSVVAYWKFESPTCRVVGSTQNGQAFVDGSGNPTTPGVISHAGGATLRSTFAQADFTLFELNRPVPVGADPYWNGWDRREIARVGALTVHHPRGHEKRISFDNEPLRISDASVPGLPGSRHWRVDDWNVGTTEPGSSGAGLLSQDKLLIGVLSGGEAACGNDSEDYFGRLSIAWEGGGTSSTRLRDWLDPPGSGAETLAGQGDCNAPTLSLGGPDETSAGSATGLSVSVSGSGPFTVEWDIDNDGVTDRRSTGIDSSSAIQPVYPSFGSAVARVRVTDSTGCVAEASRTFAVRGPSIGADAAQAVQVCGDGDSAIEPGERWRAPVILTNGGNAALTDGYAVFARGQGAAPGTGVTVQDNTGANCPFQFVDIGASPALALTASGSFPAEDDGRTAPQPLGGGALDLFGQSVTQLVMSTNGYLSTSNQDNGGDFSNSCPLDNPDDGGAGGRLHVLHDDFVVRSGGGLRRQYFASCPRAANAGTGQRGCTVFQWSNLARFSQTGAEGDFTIQAIVYDGTHQIVYQYQGVDPLQGGSATIGVQNDGNSQRAQYACNNQGRVVPGRAVCFFHPSAPPGQTPARIRLLTPSVSLGNLGSGQSTSVDALFQVDAGAACGAPLLVDYVGTVDNVAHSLRTQRLLDTTVGGGGACQTFSGFCPSPPNVDLAKRDGLYSSLVRFGNGMGAFNIPVTGGTVFGGQWYTGRRDRTPEWLILQGDISDNQADVPVFRFRQTGSNPFAVASSVVGRAQITYTSPSDYVATWVVDGVAAGEKLTLLYGTNRPTPNRTGSWFPPSESGWGLAIDDHFLPNGQSEKVIVNYFYDAASNPVWTLGGGPVAGGTQPHNLFRVHCPSCPSLPDLLADIRPAGQVTINHTGNTTATYSTAITFPAPLTGSWNRTNLPLQLISPQQAATIAEAPAATTSRDAEPRVESDGDEPRREAIR